MKVLQGLHTEHTKTWGNKYEFCVEILITRMCHGGKTTRTCNRVFGFQHVIHIFKESDGDAEGVLGRQRARAQVHLEHLMPTTGPKRGNISRLIANRIHQRKGSCKRTAIKALVLI